MTGFNSWTETTVGALQNIWGGVIGFLPSFLGALLVLIAGLIIAAGLRTIVRKIISFVKLDNLLQKAGLGKVVQHAGYELNSGKFLGAVVYWLILAVFFLAASDILNLWGVSMFLRDVVAYIPNIVAGVLIMLAAILFAGFLRNLVSASVKSARLRSGRALGAIAWWATIIFGAIATLMQLGIAISLLNTLITGIVVMVALAGGIAFGLGGRDLAQEMLRKIKDDISER